MLSVKKLFIFFCSFIAAGFLNADDVKFDFDFKAGSYSDISEDDIFDLKGEVKAKVFIADNFSLNFAIELDKYETDVEQLSFCFDSRYWDFKAGKFKNVLTLDEYLGSGRIFGRRNLITRQIWDQGYMSRSTGVLGRINHGNSSFCGNAVYIPSQTEFQIDADYLYNFNGKESYAGCFLSYYPFIKRHSWKPEEYTSMNNFFADLCVADFSGSLVYCAEYTFASNLVNPVGLINYQPDDDFPFFMGLDLYAGYKLYFSDKIMWLPALKVTIFEPEVSEFECRETEILLGNMFSYKERIKLHLDGGIGIVTNYDAFGNGDLKTKLDWRWSFFFTVD